MSRTVIVIMLSTGPTLTFAWKVPSTLLLVLSYALIRASEDSNSAFSILNFDNSLSGHTFKADPSSTIMFLVCRPLISAWMNSGFVWFLPSGGRSLSEKVISNCGLWIKAIKSSAAASVETLTFTKARSRASRWSLEAITKSHTLTSALVLFNCLSTASESVPPGILVSNLLSYGLSITGSFLGSALTFAGVLSFTSVPSLMATSSWFSPAFSFPLLLNALGLKTRPLLVKL